MISGHDMERFVFMETNSAVEEREEYRPCQLVVLNRKEQLRSKRGYWALRRGQDIFFSALALLLLWPIMLIIALIVYIDDPHGSPIFAQKRCGRDAKPFKMYKFRSMYVDAEDRLGDLLKDNEMDGPAFKMKDDPRITRVGNFLRKTKLDEIPQLGQVFLGKMSLIGPRPELLRYVSQYRGEELQILQVRPGITDYSSVEFINLDEIVGTENADEMYEKYVLKKKNALPGFPRDRAGILTPLERNKQNPDQLLSQHRVDAGCRQACV